MALSSLNVGPPPTVTAAHFDAVHFNAAHSLCALRYRLHSGPVDLTPLVIRQAREFVWERARVTAYVLGASHALTVTLPDGDIFTELLTCVPPRSLSTPLGAMPAQEWAVPDPLSAPFTHDFHDVSGISGRVRIVSFPLHSNTDGLSDAFAPENALHEPFPLSTGEMAWTRIGWRIAGSHLHVETVHTYPDDGAGVRSTTCLQFADSPLLPKRAVTVERRIL